jgi:hypothetical protein
MLSHKLPPHELRNYYLRNNIARNVTPCRAKWILGSILSILLPFWKQKREELKRIEGT